MSFWRTPKLSELGVFSFLSVLLLSGCSHSIHDTTHDEEMVYYGATARISGFDPVKSGDVASSLAIAKIYEGLLQYSYLARPYRVEPSLAESMPEVSDDGLTYTFKVRPGIYFHDDPCFEATGGKGRELVAEDFVFSMKRVADVKLEPKGYWVFNGRIAELDKFHEASKGDEPTDYDMPIEGLQALDRYTLQIKLVEPYPQLLWILAMHYSFAVPREAVEYYNGEDGRGEFLNHPVGTGPYALSSWRRNYRIEFVRSPKWDETGRVETYPEEGEPADEAMGRLADAGKPIPFVDRIVQYVVGDASTDWLMFLRGQFSVSGISNDDWDIVVNEEKELNDGLRAQGIELSAVPRMVLDYIGFNMDDPTIGWSQDPEVNERHRKLRQALTCAFNTKEWIKFNKDRVTRPTGPIPPGVSGYKEQDAAFPFDLERARRLMEEAGYKDGIDPETGRRLELIIELRSAGGAEVRQRADLLAAFMDEIGVVIKPSYNNWPQYLDKLHRRQAQVFWLGWIADYPDAENFLQLFYGKNETPGPNHSNYKNQEFDALYDQIRTMQDSPERTALYEEMAQIVINDCPWIFTSLPMSYILKHQWLDNYKHHDFPYGMNKYYRVNSDVRSSWIQAYGSN